MTLKQQAISGIKWNTIAKITTDLLTVVQLAIVARYIDKSDFGTMSIIHVVLGLVTMFADLGMYAAMMHKQGITQNQYNSLYWFNWFLNIALFLLVCALSYPVSVFYNDSRLTYLIVITAITILLAPLGKIFYTIKQKNLEFEFISIITLILNIILFFSTVIFCLLGWGIYALIIPNIIRAALSGIIYTIAGWKEFRVKFHFNFLEIKDFFKIGLYDTGAQLMDYLSYKIDVLLVGRLFGLEVLGVYNMGKELSLKVMKVLAPIINSVATPVLSKIQNDYEGLKKNYLRILQFISFINFPVLFALFVFADPVVELFFSERYADAAIFVKILCFWGMFASVGNPAGNLVIAKGRTDLSFRWTIVRFCLAPLFIYIASFFSVEAVAYSQVLLQLIFFFIYWRILIFPLSDISINEYVGALSHATLCSIIATIPSLLFHYFCCQENVWCNLVIGCMIFGLTYLIASWLFNKNIIKFILSNIKTK